MFCDTFNKGEYMDDQELYYSVQEWIKNDNLLHRKDDIEELIRSGVIITIWVGRESRISSFEIERIKNINLLG